MRPVLFIKKHGAAKIHCHNGLKFENLSDDEAEMYSKTLKNSPIRRNKIEPLSDQWYAVKYFQQTVRAIQKGGIHA